MLAWHDNLVASSVSLCFAHLQTVRDHLLFLLSVPEKGSLCHRLRTAAGRIRLLEFHRSIISSYANEYMILFQEVKATLLSVAYI